MSHRSLRRTLVPVASGLAAVIAVSWAAPAYAAAGYTGTGNNVQGQEWWLGGLHVTQTWPTTEGAGVTVAVLGTGVDARHSDLAGSVTTGPDLSGSGRTAAGPFWGIDGTEVAGVIAGHGHGTGREAGILGIAPAAKILSIRVSLEFNDPLNSDQAIARQLPAAIASGITYAVDHGARIIDLPLDPGTAGLTGQGNPAAAGGSPAERAAVAYALRKNVVLVAPAGDDGQGPRLVDYPAAYPGVIAVGAVARDGQVAPFSSRRSYVSLAAPGVGLMATVPSDGYARISSTTTSSGIVAGLAALILSRFPHLTAGQVSQALTGGTTTGRAGAPGAGRGIVDAARAVGLAASITLASQPRKPAAPARPNQPRRPSTTAAHRASASALAGSLVRYVVAGLGVLIVLLVVLLLVVRSRQERARAAAAESGSPRARARGQHEQRRPEPGPVPPAGFVGPSRSQPAPPGPKLAPPGPKLAPPGPKLAPPGPQLAPPGPKLAPPGSAVTGGWTAAGGWQGGSLGEMQQSPAAPFRPVMTPAPKPAKTAAKAAAPSSGPPWSPAPEPERTIGTLPTVANSARPPDPGPGIRVPGDMAALPTAAPDSMLPAPFDISASPDPDFPPRPAVSDAPGPGFPGRPDLPTRGGLGFAAAPVPVDYAPPQAPDFTVPSRAAGLVLSAGPNPASPDGPPRPAGPSRPAGPPRPDTRAAEPGYIWDLAATDVFPAAADPGPPTEAPGAVPADDDPGANSG